MVDTLDIQREKREKKIVKKNEMSEMIDGKRKSREEVLGCPRFWDVQITYLL